MDFLIALVSIIGGFAILIVGGETLVRASVNLAVRIKITPAVIALTIIAAGTSAPELVTSILASARNAPDIAAGNVVGSNTFNILAIIGISALIKTNTVSRTLLRLDLPFLLGSCILFVFLGRDASIVRSEGILLLALLVGFLVFSVFKAKKQGLSEKELEEIDFNSKSIVWDIVHLTLGIIALLAGAHFALEGAVSLGELLGLSERIIGVTIVSVGTGLPELATSAVAAYRGRNDIAIANVVGSNIFNTLGIIGVASTIQPLGVSPEIMASDAIWMLAGTFVIFPIIYLGKLKVNKVSGGFLLFMYVSYISYLLTVGS